MTQVLLFKVLVDRKPCYGGVPVEGDARYPKVGEWTQQKTPRCCESGWHLTTDPLRWWQPKATLWLAEGRGLISGDGGDKAAFSSVRLVQQVTRRWRYLCCFPRLRAFLAASQRSRNSKADLTWADLTGANLARADLVGADLARANLTGANLAEANLAEANLAGANVAAANLAWADLTGANLTGANLVGANLVGARRPTNPPPGWMFNAHGRLAKATNGA